MMDDYDEPMTSPGASEKSLAKRLAEIQPELHVDVRMDSHGGTGLAANSDYMKERHGRLKKEIAALESELTSFDPAAAAAMVKKSLNAELAIKRAEKLKCEAEMGMDVGGEDEDMEDSDESDTDTDAEEDGATVATGNPYSVVKRGGSYVIENNETGKVKGKHASKGKAMRQFRLLEGIEHGWHPTGKGKK